MRVVLAERIKEHHWEHNDVSSCCEKLPSLGIVFLAKIYAERMRLFWISGMMRKFVRSRWLVMSVVMVMSAPHRSGTSKISTASRHRGHRLWYSASKWTEHRQVNLRQNLAIVRAFLMLGRLDNPQRHKHTNVQNTWTPQTQKTQKISRWKVVCGDIQNTAFSFKT